MIYALLAVAYAVCGFITIILLECFDNGEKDVEENLKTFSILYLSLFLFWPTCIIALILYGIFYGLAFMFRPLLRIAIQIGISCHKRRTQE